MKKENSCGQDLEKTSVLLTGFSDELREMRVLLWKHPLATYPRKVSIQQKVFVKEL